MLPGVQKALPFDMIDAPRAVILVEERLQALDHLRVVLPKSDRAGEVDLLSSPVAHQDGASGIGVGLLEDTHGLEYCDRAGPVKESR